jgi:hypothetical protein
MLCCAIGVAAVATGAIGWRRFRRLLCERLNAHSILAATALAAAAVTVAGLAVEHFRHHGPHASTVAAASMADPAALPFCRGNAPADRITDFASIEE